MHTRAQDAGDIAGILFAMTSAVILLFWTRSQCNAMIRIMGEAAGPNTLRERAIQWGKWFLTAMFTAMIISGSVALFAILR